MKKFNITVNGSAYEVEVEEVRAAAAAAPAAPKAAAPAAAPKAAAPAAPAAAPKAAAAGERSVDAPMPGKIVEVKVSVGQPVKAGDTLLILEAMKMQNEIAAPADGTVTEITPVGMDDFVGEPCNKIVIFMSVFNVHVNRSPINGEIKLQKYYCGRFRPAYKDEVGFENEHHLIGIDRGDLRITVKQIAGILARRIVSWVTLDDRMKQGDIYGMIRFGSCLEIVMPERAQILVREGEKVQGGKTVLGRLEGE